MYLIQNFYFLFFILAWSISCFLIAANKIIPNTIRIFFFLSLTNLPLIIQPMYSVISFPNQPSLDNQLMLSNSNGDLMYLYILP